MFPPRAGGANSVKTYLAMFLVSLLRAWLATPWVRRLALHLGALDHPGDRKVHAEVMPRMGGLAVFAGFCLPWLAFLLLKNRVSGIFAEYWEMFWALLAGGTAMLLLGIYDDLKGLKATPKFVVQVAVAVALYYAGFRITRITNPFGPAIELEWLSLPLSVLWMVGITNAINLLDDIDGLATGVTACIAMSLALINMVHGNVIVALLTLALAGASFGFLPFNSSPARIFLGDTGSLFMGLLLACIGILSLFKAATVSFILVPLLVFGLPLFDTTSVMLGRLRRGTPLFQGDQSHVHHRLLRAGMNHRQASYYLYAVTLLLAGLAIFISFNQSAQGIWYFGTLGLLVAAAGWLAWRLRAFRPPGQPPRQPAVPAENEPCSNSKKPCPVSCL